MAESFFTDQTTLEVLAKVVPSPWQVEAQTEDYGVMFTAPLHMHDDGLSDSEFDTILDRIRKPFLSGSASDEEIGIEGDIAEDEEDIAASTVELEMGWPVPDNIVERLQAATEIILDISVAKYSPEIHKSLAERLQ